MRQLIKVFAICGMLMSFFASGMTVEEAKNQGLIGETLSGYLAVVNGNSAIAEKLVNDINREREKRYSEIAQKNNLNTRDVAKIAGQKLVDRANQGEYIRGINGQWLKKSH